MFKYKGDLFLIETEGNADRPGVTSWVGNPRYKFTVHRDSSDLPWVLRLIAQPDDIANDGNVALGVSNRAAWTIFDVPLPSVVTDPSFKVVKINGRSNDQNLVDMDFSINSTSKRIPRIGRLAKGHVLFDRGHDWRIQEYQVDLFDEGASPSTRPRTKVEVEIEYGDRNTAVLALKTVKYSLAWQDAAGRGHEKLWTTTYTECVACQATDSDFTLTAFGLPEPGKPSIVSRLGWYLPAVFAILFFSIAIWMRKKRAGA